MRILIQAIAILTGLYGLYLIKSALGINIFENYHAIDILKMPVKAIADQVRSLGA
ncbi:MAG: hypothetical protein WBA57_20145 [Elainellaceae cyanobacterium]